MKPRNSRELHQAHLNWRCESCGNERLLYLTFVKDEGFFVCSDCLPTP